MRSANTCRVKVMVGVMMMMSVEMYFISCFVMFFVLFCRGCVVQSYEM